jgi:hypothetical protein
MAGIFGDVINSRADFVRALSDAKRQVGDALKRLPNDPTMGAAHLQLAGIENFIAQGRTPTLDERKSVDMGVRMYREFETTDDVELYHLRNLVGEVATYFLFWPDDNAAADPDSRQYLSRVHLK